MNENETQTNPERPWIYRKSTQWTLLILLLLACGASVALEIFVTDRKAKFGIDGTFGFYAMLGFISCTAMIFLAKVLGLILKVPTDYYEKDNTNRKEDTRT